MLTTMTIGPSGVAAASQTNCPGFSFVGSVPTGEDSRAPQNGTGARARTRSADAQSEAADAELEKRRCGMPIGDTPADSLRDRTGQARRPDLPDEPWRGAVCPGHGPGTISCHRARC